MADQENGMVRVQEYLVKIGNALLQRDRKYCLAVLVLDDSGSMGAYGEAPTQALNDQIVALKLRPGAENTILMAYNFSEGEPKLVISPTQLVRAALLPLRIADGSGTRLNGSVGDVLHTALKFHAYAQEVYGAEVIGVVSVISDGGDNLSSPDEKAQEARLAEDARKCGFDLQVIGIGIEGPDLADILHFDRQHAHTVHASVAGVRHATDMSTKFVARSMSRTQVGPITMDPGTGAPGVIQAEHSPTEDVNGEEALKAHAESVRVGKAFANSTPNGTLAEQAQVAALRTSPSRPAPKKGDAPASADDTIKDPWPHRPPTE